MDAARVLLETDERGVIRNHPLLPPSSRIEAIFRDPDQPSEASIRKPHPHLAEITAIRGDIEAPAVSPEEWSGGIVPRGATPGQAGG